MTFFLLLCVYKHPQTVCPGWVGQLVGLHPLHQKALDLIANRGTYLGCGFDPQLGHVWETTNQCSSLSLPLPVSLKSMEKNISSGEV